MSFTPLIRAACERALETTHRLGFLGPLLARITLGGLFMSTGWGKVHDLDKVAAFFSELAIPAPAFHAVFVSYLELVGGALLLAGLAARFAAVPLMVSMAVAIVTAQADEVHGLADLFGLVEWTYFALLAWVATAGAGALSLDHVFFARKAASARSDVRDARLAENAA